MQKQDKKREPSPPQKKHYFFKQNSKILSQIFVEENTYLFQLAINILS